MLKQLQKMEDLLNKTNDRVDRIENYGKQFILSYLYF